MCGRYSLTTAPEALRRLFNFLDRPNLAPRYNIAPTQMAPVVRPMLDAHEPDARELVSMRWGLVPWWAKKISIGARMINARAETVATTPAFRAAFRHRRCLVPADGFYEWRTEEGRRQPFRIGMKGGAPFAFAGLWESWRAPEDAGGLAGATIESYTIVTTTANDKVRPIYPRMPVILDASSHETWLNGKPGDALTLLRPYPGEPMAFYRVNPRVNNARNDDPACIEPLDPDGSVRCVPS